MGQPLNIRAYEKYDYPTVNAWWKEHNQAVIEQDLLSDVGIVIENENGMIAVGWVYLSNSKLGKLGFIVANPRARPREKIKAIHMIIIEAERILKELGFTYIQMLSNQSTLTKMARQNGWCDVVPHDVVGKQI